jgi:hypothetical protein
MHLQNTISITFLQGKKLNADDSDSGVSVGHTRSQDWVLLIPSHPFVITGKIHSALCSHRNFPFEFFGFAFYEQAKFRLPLIMS